MLPFNKQIQNIMKKTITYLLFLFLVHSSMAQEFLPNEKQEICTDLSNLLREWYIDESMAIKLADQLLANQESGKYKAVRSRKEFANQLMVDLKKWSQDLHIQLRYSPKNAKEDEGFKVSKTAENTGISRVAVLPGGIGRIKISRFDPSRDAKDVIRSAFEEFKNEKVNAVIVDLRDCIGGNGDMMNWVMSYFLPEEPVLISKVENRKMKIKADKWSLGKDRIPVNLRLSKPLYILTSKKTFSGGEAFAYFLKHLGRATIVGETTGGAANMVTRMQLVIEDDQEVEIGSYEVLMPYIKMISPITKTNWEGTGVVPHIKITADDAWEEAFELAGQLSKK